MTMNTSRQLLTVCALAAGVLTLSSCGKKDDTKVATQVAAVVGSEEISVHQLNQVLARTNTAGASPQVLQSLNRDALEKLIDQQLAVNEATNNKLHRSPEVLAQIESAKREILANSYLQQLTSTLPKPSPEEVKAYYKANPALFSERRIFNVQEIVVPAAAGVTEQLNAWASSGKSMDEIATGLKAKGLQFNGGSATRAAEQVPLEVLPKIHAMQDGQTIVLQGPQTATLLRLVASQQSPVAEAAASPRIEQFLFNQRANEAVRGKLKDLRSASNIVYKGEFAENAASVAAKDAVTASQPAPADTAGAAIEKGVAGLK